MSATTNKTCLATEIGNNASKKRIYENEDASPSAPTNNATKNIFQSNTDDLARIAMFTFQVGDNFVCESESIAMFEDAIVVLRESLAQAQLKKSQVESQRLFIKARTECYEAKKKLANTQDETAPLPSAIRFKFTLAGSEDVKDLPEYKDAQQRCETAIEACQSALKKEIIGAAGLRVEVARKKTTSIALQIIRKTCNDIIVCVLALYPSGCPFAKDDVVDYTMRIIAGHLPKNCLDLMCIKSENIIDASKKRFHEENGIYIMSRVESQVAGNDVPMTQDDEDISMMKPVDNTTESIASIAAYFAWTAIQDMTSVAWRAKEITLTKRTAVAHFRTEEATNKKIEATSLVNEAMEKNNIDPDEEKQKKIDELVREHEKLRRDFGKLKKRQSKNEEGCDKEKNARRSQVGRGANNGGGRGKGRGGGRSGNRNSTSNRGGRGGRNQGGRGKGGRIGGPRNQHS